MSTPGRFVRSPVKDFCAIAMCLLSSNCSEGLAQGTVSVAPVGVRDDGN